MLPAISFYLISVAKAISIFDFQSNVVTSNESKNNRNKWNVEVTTLKTSKKITFDRLLENAIPTTEGNVFFCCL